MPNMGKQSTNLNRLQTVPTCNEPELGDNFAFQQISRHVYETRPD